MSSEPAVDPRGPRFAAWVTTVVLILVLVTGSWLLLALQAIVFGWAAFYSLQSSPYSVAFRKWVQPELKDPDEREDAAPVRFAQGLGFVFAVIGFLGYVTGLTALGVIATALALIAAFLNAAFGFCLGCQLYPMVQRVMPAITKQFSK